MQPWENPIPNSCWELLPAGKAKHDDPPNASPPISTGWLKASSPAMSPTGLQKPWEAEAEPPLSESGKETLASKSWKLQL